MYGMCTKSVRSDRLFSWLANRTRQYTVFCGQQDAVYRLVLWFIAACRHLVLLFFCVQLLHFEGKQGFSNDERVTANPDI